MTEVAYNYDFEQVELSKNQVKVTNSTTRTIEHLELVYLGGYFGEVRDVSPDGATPELYGIAASGVGYINIDHERLIRTKQVGTSQTFTAGNVLYFDPQSNSAAGLLYDSQDSNDFVPVGIITDAGASNDWVEFKPFVQRISQGMLSGPVDDIVYTKTFAVDADATTALPITGIPVGATIIGGTVQCTAANASGTLTLQDGAGTPNDITDAIVCAVDKVMVDFGTLDDDYTVVTTDGLQVVANGAADRGILQIQYKL